MQRAAELPFGPPVYGLREHVSDGHPESDLQLSVVLLIKAEDLCQTLQAELIAQLCSTVLIREEPCSNTASSRERVLLQRTRTTYSLFSGSSAFFPICVATRGAEGNPRQTSTGKSANRLVF